MDCRPIETHNRERSLAPTEALERAFAHAASRGISLNWRVAGRRLQSTSCDLRAADGSTTVGRGKGIGNQSVASAVYEALEHYHHLSEDITKHIGSRSLNLAKLEEPLASASPDLRLIGGRKEVPLTCLRFQNLQKSYHHVDIPAFLFNPDFKSENLLESELIERLRLYRYSSNSGTASGISLGEARLHGLLEVIERDAVGMAFVRHILAPAPKPVRAIDFSTIPNDLKNILGGVKEESSSILQLWDITSNLEIPTILCALTTSGAAPHRFFGSGSSLSKEYALERAALEALQGFHIQLEFGTRLQPALKRLPLSANLYHLCELRHGHFGFRGGEVLVDWHAVTSKSEHVAHQSVECHLEEILKLLLAHGYEAFSRTILEDDVCVVQVAVPQLERLFLLGEGLSVGPGPRARSARALLAVP
ncbi:YcaO-like family protein [Xanthobacter versatilis]|uniref:YcaO-like family protein n=1 Tax=Xanthobacter autotrophicus (strain ATCC BAA-1158 / Py2) TaxID=78245 RepID=UPI00372CF5A8